MHEMHVKPFGSILHGDVVALICLYMSKAPRKTAGNPLIQLVQCVLGRAPKFLPSSIPPVDSYVLQNMPNDILTAELTSPLMCLSTTL